MPLMSFSGETSRGPFWKQILAGRKSQTARKPRKRAITKGATLYLYWKCRVPKDKKPVHFIGKATCTKVERMRYGDFAFDDDFARRDGFKDHLELQEWFGFPPWHLDDEYDVITWKLQKSS